MAKASVIIDDFIAVDYFGRSPSIKCYFLTHAHADHCCGLNPNPASTLQPHPANILPPDPANTLQPDPTSILRPEPADTPQG
uniref:Lactamase_B domain-containing protein n=1 Tax=Ascaris lumbricoides TaxID=6252 RepID=A0A0M3IBP7_ASCLU